MTGQATTKTRRGLLGIASAVAIGLALLQPSTGSADGAVTTSGTVTPTPTPAPKLTTPDAQHCVQGGGCFFLRNSNG